MGVSETSKETVDRSYAVFGGMPLAGVTCPGDRP